MLTDLDYLRDNIGLLCAVITFVYFLAMVKWTVTEAPKIKNLLL